MIPRFDLVVFDWDGTLMPSTGAIIEAFAYAAKALGYPVPDADKTRRAIGMGRSDAMHFLMPDCRSVAGALLKKRTGPFTLRRKRPLRFFPEFGNYYVNCTQETSRLLLPREKASGESGAF